ncbi:DUF262 domain-containing protein [Candidatus Nomurabacteria bacterium]|nr:DUF262 domain-containing protein [Candidatus Nomurabacteria bacterium]
MERSAIKEEEETFVDVDHNQPVPPANVVAYNELRSCADLHRMHASGKLEIQPDFQREVVWKAEEQARFIDSLVKQLPIPSMCFSLDPQSQKWKVIDGLQRMHTITSFLGSAEWRVAPADDIHALLRGKRNSQLRTGTDEEKRLFASVEDISVPITVIRCSYGDPSHMRYLFTIFNRLNSGGVRLNNQEIRNCIYSGAFNDLLKKIDRENRAWKQVTRQIWGKMDRFRSVEILLRVLAFTQNLRNYDGNLAGFLNDYMLAASKSSPEALEIISANLTTMAGLAAMVLESLSSGKKSLTFVEGILVGILANVANAPASTDATAPEWTRQRVERFTNLTIFGDGARYALANAQIVKERLQQAVSAFA